MPRAAFVQAEDILLFATIVGVISVAVPFVGALPFVIILLLALFALAVRFS